MAKQTINIGTVANDGTGDTIRDAFDKANDNFTETYDNAATAQAAADDAQTDATQAISDAAAAASAASTAQGTANAATAALATKADLVAGKVPASQLPAYVDDVLEFANLAAFPVTGEADKIYIAMDTNLTYRWSGSAYVNLDTSLALGETSATAYRGDRGKTAYDHSQIVSGNPHGVTAALVGFIFKETPTGLINGSNTIFTLTQPPIAGSEHIFLNGLLQEVASDYTLSTNTITYLIAPETGDKLKVTYCHA